LNKVFFLELKMFVLTFVDAWRGTVFDARLAPVDRYGAANLNERECVAIVGVYKLLGFDKVGHVAVVVDASTFIASAFQEKKKQN
jgi:hypothetical protein